MISGYRGLAIDVWLSQRSYLALAEVRYEERQDGADDILEILRKSFPAGLATSRSEYQASLKAAPDNIDLGSLGEPVIERQLDADATLRVYQVELRKAQQAVKVRTAAAGSHAGESLCCGPQAYSATCSGPARALPAPPAVLCGRRQLHQP